MSTPKPTPKRRRAVTPKHRRKGRRALTQQDYDRLLESFRKTPGNFNAAAKSAGVHGSTAKRAWEQGWPKLSKAMGPIREIVEREQEQARAQMAEAEKQAEQEAAAAAMRRRAEAEKARQDAVDSRKQETLLVRGARTNTLALMASSQRMLRGINALSARLEAELTRMGQPVGHDASGNPIFEELNAVAVTRLIQTIASAIRQGNEAALITMRMERLHVGEPEAWIGVELSAESLRESVIEIQRANRAVERARQRGLLLIEGGKEEKQVDSTNGSGAAAEVVGRSDKARRRKSAG